MNPDLDRLQPYPFERLARLVADVEPAQAPAVNLAIGEPRGPPPAVATAALAGALDGLGRYPATDGSAELRAAVAAWLTRRYGIGAIDADTQVLPVNGTREALFSFAQAVVDRTAPEPTVALPNPCYQIYEGAAVLAGARCHYYPAGSTAAPDFDAIPDTVWDRCQLLYVCSPGNPTGAVVGRAALAGLIERARRHDFVIAADECYAEIHDDDRAPPPGLLEAARAAGHDGFERCVVFHSLSKRSGLPGLRSGFVAGDARLLAGYRRYRTYHGTAMPPPAQAASIAAWDDETHVRANRAAYRERIGAALAALDGALAVEAPVAGFYLWPRIPDDDDEGFARGLLAAEGVRVLPGRYLGRDVGDGNPGAGRARMALVPSPEACAEAGRRIRRFARERYGPVGAGAGPTASNASSQGDSWP